MVLSCCKEVSVLLGETTSKHHSGFHCLNSLHFSSKCKSNKKVCENIDFCNAAMLFEDTNI